MLIISLSMYANFLPTLLYDRRAAETSFATFTVNIYCKLFLKKSLLILTPSLFQFDRMQNLPENHFRVSGASLVNIINY